MIKWCRLNWLWIRSNGRVLRWRRAIFRPRNNMEFLEEASSYPMLTERSPFYTRRGLEGLKKKLYFNNILQKMYEFSATQLDLLVLLHNQLLSITWSLQLAKHLTANTSPLLHYSVRILSAWQCKTNDSPLSRSSDLPQERECIRVQLQLHSSDKIRKQLTCRCKEPRTTGKEQFHRGM
jgi:hypothetical protein